MIEIFFYILNVEMLQNFKIEIFENKINEDYFTDEEINDYENNDSGK